MNQKFLNCQRDYKYHYSSFRVINHIRKNEYWKNIYFNKNSSQREVCINVFDLIKYDDKKRKEELLNLITEDEKFVEKMLNDVRKDPKNEQLFFYLLYRRVETNQYKDILCCWLDKLKDHLSFEEKSGILCSAIFKKNFSIETINEIESRLGVDLTNEEYLASVLNNFKKYRKISIEHNDKRISCFESLNYLLNKLEVEKREIFLHKIYNFFMENDVSEDFIYYNNQINKNNLLNLDFQEKLANWMSERKILVFNKDIADFFQDKNLSEKIFASHFFSGVHEALVKYNVVYMQDNYPDFFKNIENLEIVLKNVNKNVVVEKFIDEIEDLNKSFFTILKQYKESPNEKLDYSFIFKKLLLKKCPQMKNDKQLRKLDIPNIVILFENNVVKENLLKMISEEVSEKRNRRL